MFDIGFSELLLIAVAGIVVIGPKDLPVVVRHVATFLREVRGVYAGLKSHMNAMMDEAGINDMKREMTTIIDLEGKPQVAYDVRELEELRLASPLAGEATRLSERSELSRSGEGASTHDSQTSAAPSPNPLPQGEGALQVSAPAAARADKP
jgi:sec-independent protein translocase protein TatB